MKRPRLNPELRHQVQLYLARTDQLWQLLVLGALSGLVAGLVIIAFRLLVESIQASFLVDGNPENYEALPWWLHFLLPVIGGLLIGLIFQAAQARYRQVGVVYVMERLAHHQGKLPLGNAVMQFIGAAISIIAGHSVGREGPAIHLGATSGSLLSQWLKLSNSSGRTLVACGIAAAIAASFNTPLAGVVFAIEVLMMKYTLVSVTPVIFAAVTSTAISRAVFGSEPVFSVPAMQINTLAELPYVLLTGLVMGGLAALFCYALKHFSQVAKEQPLWQRTTLAGVLVGLCAIVTPAVMSIGYDTVNSAMLGQMGIAVLLLITIMKLLATSAGLGLGLPGGLIGPTLFIGATAGAAIGQMAVWLSPDIGLSPGLYAMIGMGAMMGATLQAPLAALTALLELTANPNIILPAMLAIVAASFINAHVFRNPSIFLILARLRGLDYLDSPLIQTLRDITVLQVVDKKVQHLASAKVSLEQIEQLRQHQPHWLIFDRQDSQAHVIRCATLMQSTAFELDKLKPQAHLAMAIDMRASLQEAYALMQEADVETLFIVNEQDTHCSRILGIVSLADIKKHFQL